MAQIYVKLADPFGSYYDIDQRVSIAASPKLVEDTNRIQSKIASGYLLLVDSGTAIAEIQALEDSLNLVTEKGLATELVNFGDIIDVSGFNELRLYVSVFCGDSSNVYLEAFIKTLSGDTFKYASTHDILLYSFGCTNEKTVFSIDTSDLTRIQLKAMAINPGQTPITLKGSTGAENVPATWAAVTDGSFRISISGVAYNVDAINFTGVTTMEGVAQRIQDSLRAVTGNIEKVTWILNTFYIYADLDSTSITVAGTSTGVVGTDISTAAWMDNSIGSIIAATGVRGKLTIKAIGK